MWDWRLLAWLHSRRPISHGCCQSSCWHAVLLHPPHPAVALIHTTSCRDFYCHSVGHYLGLDVHDTNTIGPYRTLEPGVVLAIEPGLYIPNHPQFGPYAGIGVRIEDDVLITQTGCEVGSWVGAGVVPAHDLRKSPSATRVAPMRVITTPELPSVTAC